MHITQKSSAVVTATEPTVHLPDTGPAMTPRPLFAYPDNDEGPTVALHGVCSHWCVVDAVEPAPGRSGRSRDVMPVDEMHGVQVSRQ